MPDSNTASELIDQRIAELADWRGHTLAQVRRLIHEADPEVLEEWKWRGVPTWSHLGLLCTGETYKAVVKLTFAKGASLPDPVGLFNASLDGSTRRAIDIREGEALDPAAFRDLIREAVRLNLASKGRPKLLSGDNPQIPKGVGDAPVQAYLEAIPGWKQSVARQIDAVITKAVPNVQKAVKWNSPLYGLDGRTWFMSFHCYARFVKVAFFQGASLEPQPPVGSKQPNVRYLHVIEAEALDEQQLASWAHQASLLPGERM